MKVAVRVIKSLQAKFLMRRQKLYLLKIDLMLNIPKLKAMKRNEDLNVLKVFFFYAMKLNHLRDFFLLEKKISTNLYWTQCHCRVEAFHISSKNW